MPRNIFLLLASFIAFAIGSFTFLAPEIMVLHVKHAEASLVANVMVRTVGVLLLTMALINFLVRNDPDSNTMKSILLGNLFLQIIILPIDPYAYYTGIYNGLDSFVPNTILHILLSGGFLYYIIQMNNTGEKQNIPEGV